MDISNLDVDSFVTDASPTFYSETFETNDCNATILGVSCDVCKTTNDMKCPNDRDRTENTCDYKCDFNN